MLKRHTNSEDRKLVVGIGIGGVVLTVLCKIGVATAQACILLDCATWATLEALRSAILVLGSQTVSAYLSQDSGVADRLLQIGIDLWPLLYTVIGRG